VKSDRTIIPQSTARFFNAHPVDARGRTEHDAVTRNTGETANAARAGVCVNRTLGYSEEENTCVAPKIHPARPDQHDRPSFPDGQGAHRHTVGAVVSCLKRCRGQFWSSHIHRDNCRRQLPRQQSASHRAGCLIAGPRPTVYKLSTWDLHDPYAHRRALRACHSISEGPGTGRCTQDRQRAALDRSQEDLDGETDNMKEDCSRWLGQAAIKTKASARGIGAVSARRSSHRELVHFRKAPETSVCQFVPTGHGTRLAGYVGPSRSNHDRSAVLELQRRCSEREASSQLYAITGRMRGAIVPRTFRPPPRRRRDGPAFRVSPVAYATLGTERAIRRPHSAKLHATMSGQCGRRSLCGSKQRSDELGHQNHAIKSAFADEEGYAQQFQKEGGRHWWPI